MEKISDDHEELYEKHKNKEKTPSMGGIVILAALLVSVLIWSDVTNFYIQMALLSIGCIGVLGFVDDYRKCLGTHGKGLKIRTKFFWQLMFTVFIGGMIYRHNPEHLSLTVPFLKNVVIELGWLYVIFMFLVILSTCNAVNITDGLDGLASGTLITAFMTYFILAYVAGHVGLSHYLHVLYIPGSGELAVLCAATIGACLGFLWFNAYPASIFMGDTGSLTLGSLLGLVAILVKQELVLLVVGGVFVIETISVIIQIAVFKTTGKRFFLIAPIHHHFEMKGLPETKIVIRFWIVSVLFALIGLSTLKLR